MGYIKQTYTDGDLFTPYIMNRMEDGAVQDVFVVPVTSETTPTSSLMYTATVYYNEVKEAILNNKLVIYMIHIDSTIQEYYARLAEDGEYIIVNNGEQILEEPYYAHYYTDNMFMRKNDLN